MTGNKFPSIAYFLDEVTKKPPQFDAEAFEKSKQLSQKNYFLLTS